MEIIDKELLKKELLTVFSRPWLLPKRLLVSAAATFVYFAFIIYIHRYSRGLPYIGASLFVWTLAAINASLLGSYDSSMKDVLKNKHIFRQFFIIKNISLLLLALPIDILFIVLACVLLNDWSKFWFAIILGIAAIIISFGLGNLVSVSWAYKPEPVLTIRHDRVRMLDYGIFSGLSYLAASLALTVATLIAAFLLKLLGTNSKTSMLIGIAILISISVLCWILSVNISYNIAQKHFVRIIARTNGKTLDIKNTKLKKILKVS